MRGVLAGGEGAWRGVDDCMTIGHGEGEVVAVPEGKKEEMKVSMGTRRVGEAHQSRQWRLRCPEAA